MAPEEFYDSVSVFYDAMVQFDSALPRRAAMFKQLLPTVAGSAADFGCGTGLDTAALCLLGWNVTSFDLSAGMLARARENLTRHGLNAALVQSGLHKIPPAYNGKFSAVVCMGNTLANLSPETAETALLRAGELLAPGGVLLLHLLNFSRVLSRQEKIVAITRASGYATVRYYEFHQSRLLFNILRYNEENPAERTLNSTPLYPHRPEEITRWCVAAGMRPRAQFGESPAHPFSAEESANFLAVFGRE